MTNNYRVGFGAITTPPPPPPAAPPPVGKSSEQLMVEARRCRARGARSAWK